MATKEKKNIYQRISAIAADVPPIEKDSKVEFGQSYKYTSHDYVSGIIRPLLGKHGVAMITSLASWKQDGNRLEAIYTIDFVNIDDPEDRVTTQWIGYGVDNQDKGPGKACSYATKYAAMKTFLMSTGDDPEASNINHLSTGAAPPAKKTPKAKPKGGPKPKPDLETPPRVAVIVGVSASEIEGVMAVEFRMSPGKDSEGETVTAMLTDENLIEKCREYFEAKADCLIVLERTARGNLALVSITTLDDDQPGGE